MTEQELYNEYQKSDCKSFTDFLINKIGELEKENAELKGRIETLERIKREHTDYTIKVEEERTLAKDQLSKAKELLERFLGLGNLWDLDCKDYFPLRKEAEQFLSEVEK